MTNFVSDIIDNKCQLYLIKVKLSNNKICEMLIYL